MNTQLGKEMKYKTINHLLDASQYNGYHEGRISHVLMWIASIGIPALFIVEIYILLANLLWSPVMAIVIIVIVYVLYAMRTGLYFLGNERERVKRYRKQLYSRYDAIGEYVKIKNVYREDGCIEFFDGTIAFMVLAFNGNAGGIRKFKQIQKFLEIVDNYENDILIQNTANGATLNHYYNKIAKFEDKRVASDYLAILDHNKQYVTDKSRVVRTVYIFYGKKFERRSLRELLNDALPTQAYFDVHLADRDEVIDVYSHEAQKTLDFDALITNRFATGQYYTSKVIEYDADIPPEIRKKKFTNSGEDKRSFIPEIKVAGSADYFSQ